MFSVDCPGCKATFSVDERRVPATGLKMRCPKCQTSFTVHRPNEGDLPAVAGAALPAPTAARPVAAPPPAPPPRPPSPSNAGAAGAPRPPAPAQQRGGAATLRDIPATAAKKPASKFPSAMEISDLPGGADDNVDLPSVSSGLDAGLPAVPAPRAAAASKPTFDDLPAQRGKAPAPPPPRPPAPSSPRADLPSVAGAKKDDPFGDLPIPAVNAATPSPGRPAPPRPAAPGAAVPRPAVADFPDDELDLPAPAMSIGLPAPATRGPAPQAARHDAPKPNVDADLPTVSPGAALPSPKAAAARPAPGVPPPRAPSPSQRDLDDDELGLPVVRAGTDPGQSIPDMLPIVHGGARPPSPPSPAARPGPPAAPTRPTTPGIPAARPSPAAAAPRAPSAITPAVAPAAASLAASAPAPLANPVMGGALFDDDSLSMLDGADDSPPSLEDDDAPLELELGVSPPRAPATPYGSTPNAAPPSSISSDGLAALPKTPPPPPPPGGAIPRGARPPGGQFGEIDFGVDFNALEPEPDPFGRGGSPATFPPPGQDAGFQIERTSVVPPGGGAMNPPAASQGAPKPAGGKAAGGTAWGEVDLGANAEESMEFDAIPQEKAPAAPPQTTAGGTQVMGAASIDLGAPARVNDPKGPGGSAGVAAGGSAASASAAAAEAAKAAREAAPPKKKSKKAFIAMGIIGVIGVIGGGLAFTPFGPFGYLAIYDATHKADYDQQFQTLQRDGKNTLLADTADQATKAVSLASAAHDAVPRANQVAAYGAMLIAQRELRYGSDPVAFSKATSWMAEIPPDRTGAPFDTARAVVMAASPQGLARGKAALDAMLRINPGDSDALAAAGEVALLTNDNDRALEYWTRLAGSEKSPRAVYGLVRAYIAKRDTAAATKTARELLAAAPNHVGARISLGKMIWATTNDEAAVQEALGDLSKNAERRAAASSRELADASILMGQIHLARSRVTLAEAAFNEALKIDPKSSTALAGVGEALYRAGRNSEALAKFKSAAESDPTSITARVGMAKTTLALERLAEGKDLLKALTKQLKDENRSSFEATSWLGRADELLGDKAAAEAGYVEGIKIGGTDPGIIDTYVWLAKLLSGLGRDADATARLEEAKTKFPKSSKLFKALGDIAMQAGRLEDADREFNAALAIDDSDVSLRFRLAIALRKRGKFDAAATEFDRVAAVDKEFPGLSLERAALFEASKQLDKALEMYQAALAKAPNDVDLMLRVAAALLSGSHPASGAAQAEDLLKKVIAQRGASAEAHHYLGRAYLVRGTNLPEAIKFLRRAAELDSNRAEYFLYVGWAANEADNQQLASTSLDKALELDHGLADAYWQRGVLRRRQRAVVDAEKDLTRALELQPGRAEARATLAEVLEDQQKWSQAEASWQLAIRAEPDRADWQFRFGKLLSVGKNKAGTLEHLTAAVTLAGQMQTPPKWYAEANLLLAEVERAAGKKAEAIEHYQRFLSIAPADSPYRKDAQKGLAALGPK